MCIVLAVFIAPFTSRCEWGGECFRQRSTLARSPLSSASSSPRRGARHNGRLTHLAIRMVSARPGSRCPAIQSTCRGGCLSGGFPPDLNAPASRLQLRKGRHCVCTPLRFRVRYAFTERSNAVQTCAILASLECTCVHLFLF